MKPPPNGNQINNDTGRSTWVEVKDQKEIDSLNVGMYFPPTIIKGSVFDDTNKNGVKDSGKKGLPDVSVELYCKNNVSYEVVEAYGYRW